MFKSVIFDMDGVIIDSEPLHRKSYYLMFEELNIEVTEDLYASFTGMATMPICEKICDFFSLKQSPETLVDTKRKYFSGLFEKGYKLHLIKGVLELIKHYYENGITLVLASSASMENIEIIFKKFDLNQYFQAKISGAELKESKPNPEIFIKATELTGNLKEDCMVIEDATNGIRAAKSAGLFCVAYNGEGSNNQDYSKADLIINNFKNIYIEKLKIIKNN